ncbi:hypothetical protein SAMN05444000_107169 [Shimia gijangensis]|uniref:Sulfotransferase family protein n=1 Tax=Shimia gijangensis TaxID=1470563 RepID=A0A1M6IMD5_9RHOB|nr:hypothetical protein [Shimia gijangensis]SHJ35577.1 hypothetical protein SAMN05444000_107169 [Shimia gijangensis]
MLVFVKQKLAFLSVPKTGSTAYETALRPQADIIFTKRYKHMTVGKFHNKTAPFLKKSLRLEPERIAVMRNPVDQIRSWYKFRSPERLGDDFRNTGQMSFDEFVLDVISDAPSPAACIGSQFGFLSIRDGSVPVHHLFAYEKQPLIRAFLAERFEEEIKLKPRNVSPHVYAPISPEVEQKLRIARAQEFDLYARIIDHDGVLRGFSTAPQV